MTDATHVAIPHNHAVNFYDQDAEIVSEVARFVADGLARGERVVIIATAEHRDALDEVLLQYGADAVRARITGRYLTLDARETLAKFMVEGTPDAAKFLTVIGGIIDAAAHDGCAVRAFGEMVALLWDEGEIAAAMELEALWNDLATTRQFTLLCAYPLAALDGGSLNDANRVCELHSEVFPPRSYGASVTRLAGQPDGAAHDSDVFVPVPAAVPAARRFVAGVLKSWGEDALLADAVLITSELATNAVIHAASPFRVRLRRAHTVIRIAIEDVGPSRPQERVSTPSDFGGRGVAIVRTLASQWGCDVLSDGKIVWAELTRADAV
jgi:anti-sigma regulatory factor (Ser/Thr protein kinase)